MKLSTAVLWGFAAGLARSNPVEKRQVDSDAVVLNYALTLEHLEATFYAEGLKNFTHQDFLDAGFLDPFYNNLQHVASDEKTHVEFLTKALKAAGAEPVEACTYDFPVTDPKTFVATGNIFEGVGDSAYLGAAAKLASKKYLTDAGAILSTEARHSSYFRAELGEIPFTPFGTPLDFDEVYTIVSPFIASCPSSNGMLPVNAFPSLTPTSSQSVMPGSMVTLTAGSGAKEMGNVHAAFITVTGPVWADVTSKGNGVYNVTIPMGIDGQSYVVLTKGDQTVSDNTIFAGPAILQVGPTVGIPSSSGGMIPSASSSSAPIIQPHPVGGQAQITFIGAANGQFTQSFPTSGATVQITNPLSISHIESNTDGVSCVFNGIDNGVTTVNGAQLVDVGSPQTQVSGSCKSA